MNIPAWVRATFGVALLTVLSGCVVLPVPRLGHREPQGYPYPERYWEPEISGTVIITPRPPRRPWRRLPY